MVEKALPLNFHNEFQRIFSGVGKEKPYPEPGLKSAMTRQGRQSRLGGGILEGLPRLLGAINTGGIFDAVPFSLPPSLTEGAFIEF
jgi:hypothetical protein